jgi:hypothetical protein
MSTAIQIDSAALGDLGTPKPIELPATLYRQGGRTMYHASVTLAQVTQIVPKRPDPEQPIEGNRKVDAGRAKKFGEYVLSREDWVSPAIIVRAPSGEIEFTPAHQFPDGTAWGVLKIPLHVLTEILLLDGQHRTLGTFLALDEINERIRKSRDSVEAAARNDSEPEVRALLQNKLDRDLETRERMNREHIAIDMAVVSTDQAKQMFADIANNAKGVNRDFTTILDQREVVNRMAADLIQDHELLKDRVETGQGGRMSAKNPNFVGAKAIADVVRAVHVGVIGRIGNRVEDELSRQQPQAVAEVEDFFNTLVAANPDLRAMIDGDIQPIELREEGPHRSMISSATMLRVLAGVYHDLMHPADGSQPLTRAEVEVFFAKLAPKLKEVPVAETNTFWMSTGAFLPGAAAPQARQGSLKTLTRELVTRARDGHPEL